MKKKRSKEKILRIRVKKDKVVTFKLPKDLRGWYNAFKTYTPLLRNVKYIGVTIAMIAVINMHEVFQQIQFSQETTGTLIWAFVLLGMLGWGFR